MNDKKVLITGISGFVGSCLRKVIDARFSNTKIFGIDKIGEISDNEGIVLDLIDLITLQQFIHDIQPDYIFHLAGIIYSQDWNTLYQCNVQATINLIEAVRESSPHCRIIISGSAAEYGNVAECDLPINENHPTKPVSPYGVSKLWQTVVAQYYAKRGVDVVIGRLFNLLGRGVSENLVIGSIIKQMKEIKNGQAEPRIFLGNTKTKRDFLDLTDACNGLCHLALEGRTREIYNICSGSSVPIENIIKMIIDLSGMHIVVAIDEKKIKDADIGNSYGSNYKILSETKWQRKKSLQETIESILNEI
jgi:GDP-4-dehydro-6-deoxy-D-mannose reductase